MTSTLNGYHEYRGHFSQPFVSKEKMAVYLQLKQPYKKRSLMMVKSSNVTLNVVFNLYSKCSCMYMYVISK